MNTPEEAILILQAFAAGKTLQVQNHSREWVDRLGSVVTKMPNFTDFTYRVKPEPKEKWYITFSRSDTTAATWVANTATELDVLVKRVKGDTGRTVLYIVKETDGVRTFVENPVA